MRLEAAIASTSLFPSGNDMTGEQLWTYGGSMLNLVDGWWRICEWTALRHGRCKGPGLVLSYNINAYAQCLTHSNSHLTVTLTQLRRFYLPHYDTDCYAN